MLKVMAYLQTRRGIVLVALSVGTAVLNARCGHGVNWADGNW
jgi:hypothetical protein